jgi:hypothetical protein
MGLRELTILTASSLMMAKQDVFQLTLEDRHDHLNQN